MTQRLIRETCKIAAEDIGKEKANRIMNAASVRFEELKKENATDSKALRAHTFKRIYPAIAVYETMVSEDIEKEKAVWYVREYFQRFAQKAVPHLQRFISLFKLQKKIPDLFMKISLSGFSPEAGFGYEFPERQGNEARFNIVRCPYHEACKRYGCGNLTRVFCDGDDAGYGNMHPDLIWGRTETIGRGYEKCNFLLEYRKK